MTEDIIDLVLETARQHLVSLVEDKLLDILGLSTFLLIMSKTRPGVPTTMCWPTSNFLMSSLWIKVVIA